MLAIRGLLHMTKNFVMWCDFRVKSLLRNPFEKFSFKKSWCCRKHVFVFEIVSLKGLNKFDQIIFFPVTFWVKDLVRHYGKSVETFPFLGVGFLLF